MRDLGHFISLVSVLLAVCPNSFSSAAVKKWLFIPFLYDHIKSGTPTILESFIRYFGQLRSGANVEVSKEQAEERNDSYMEGWMKSERP